MPGHMGSERVTMRGVQIFKVDTDKNIMIIKGSVPGPRGGLVIIKRTSKGSRDSAAA
jgi:large subunit ribosomal protein L3